MNKRALLYGLGYSVLAISFKIYMVLSWNLLTRFGWTYSTFLSTILVIPFVVLAIRGARKHDFGGTISGREALRIGMTVVAVSAVLITVYNYIEVEWKLKEFSNLYYNSDQYLDFVHRFAQNNPGKIKSGQLPGMISQQISDVSAFKAATGRLVTLLFIGLSTSFVAAVFLKNGPQLQR